MRTRLLTGLVTASVCVTGCALSFLGRDFTPIGPDPASPTPDVAATYEWIANIQGSNSYTLTGTIAFEQSGNRVSVANTTHSNPANRDLIGTADLEGNVLTMQMVPRNGDTDYVADVTFRFSADGDRFEVDFSDTNEDFGPAFGFRTRDDNP